MSTQRCDITLIDEIIDNASELPLEYQDCLLSIAKGMLFTKSCLNKQAENKPDEQRTVNSFRSNYN